MSDYQKFCHECGHCATIAPPSPSPRFVGGCLEDSKGYEYHKDRVLDRFDHDRSFEAPGVAPAVASEPFKGAGLLFKRPIIFKRPISDQAWAPSCVGNAVADVVEYLIDKSNPKAAPCEDLSRMMPWIIGRALQHGLGDVKQGTYIPAAIASLAVVGIAREALVPYTLEQAGRLPDVEAMRDAREHRYGGFFEIEPDQIEAQISAGSPVIFGIGIGGTFMSPDPGKIYDGEGSRLIGGHCMTVISYDEECFRLRNSWGERWGERGTLRVSKKWIRKYAYNCFAHDLRQMRWA